MKNRILVIGSTVADVHITLDHLPSLEEDVHPRGQRLALGGCAYNVASAIAALGMPYTLFSPVGKGIYGDFIRTECARGEVHPVLESEEENGCCYCLIDDSGNRTFMSLHGAEYRFRREWFDALDMSGYGWIYVCGLEIEEETGKNIIAFLQTCGSHPVCFAPGPRILAIDRGRCRQMMELASLIHLNRTEAVSWLQREGITAETAADAAAALSQVSGADTVVTDGSRPAAVCMNRELYTIPVEPAEQVNGTGAGDAHAGAILAALAAGRNLPEAVALAGQVSRLVVQSSNSSLSRKELLAGGIRL